MTRNAPCPTLADCRCLIEAERRTKYGNRRTAYGGRVYASALEASIARELDLRQRAGDIREWKPQPRIKLEVAGRLVCTYVADFEVLHNDGTVELIEAKGCETAVWRLKRKLFEALYPDRTLTVVRRP